MEGNCVFNFGEILKASRGGQSVKFLELWKHSGFSMMESVLWGKVRYEGGLDYQFCKTEVVFFDYVDIC